MVGALPKEKINEVSYKLSEKDASQTGSFIFEHEAYIQSLLGENP